jgi:hypothetical protein
MASIGRPDRRVDLSVAQFCSGSVGAVFCIEASRLARNGRDMRRTNLSGAICPIPRSLDAIGDWWTILIVRYAF